MFTPIFFGFSFIVLLGIIHSFVVIIFFFDAHYSFVHFSNLTLALSEFIDITVNHDEFVFYVSTLNLGFHFLVTEVPIRQSTLHSVLLSIFLEVNETILHHMKLLNLLLASSAISFLLLDKLCSF